MPQLLLGQLQCASDALDFELPRVHTWILWGLHASNYWKSCQSNGLPQQRKDRKNYVNAFWQYQRYPFLPGPPLWDRCLELNNQTSEQALGWRRY